MKTSVTPVRLIRSSSPKEEHRDLVATEEPLEIRLTYGKDEHRREMQLAVTMRTPGHDLELVTGFLFSESIINKAADILQIRHCTSVSSEEERGNVVKVQLAPEVVLSEASLKRHFYTTSSCGVCGKSSLEAVQSACQPIVSEMTVEMSHVIGAPEMLREAQQVFEHTGGLHAAGLLNMKGVLEVIREDVGRHNALDKLIGSGLSSSRDFSQSFLVLSGRASFELIQKAGRAGISIVVAVGAPSSLAVQLAQSLHITLIGFARKGTFNCYTLPERIKFS
jgi:FdhD protein